MTPKQITIVVLVGLAGFSAGKFTGPAKVEVKEVERVVYRDKIVRDEYQQARIEQHEIRRLDGTVEIRTVTDLNSEIKEVSETKIESETEKQTTTVNRPDWSIGLYRGSGEYLGTLDRRILGGLSLGVYGRTEGTWSGSEFGIGLRLEF